MRCKGHTKGIRCGKQAAPNSNNQLCNACCAAAAANTTPTPDNLWRELEQLRVQNRNAQVDLQQAAGGHNLFATVPADVHCALFPHMNNKTLSALSASRKGNVGCSARAELGDRHQRRMVKRLQQEMQNRFLAISGRLDETLENVFGSDYPPEPAEMRRITAGVTGELKGLQTVFGVIGAQLCKMSESAEHEVLERLEAVSCGELGRVDRVHRILDEIGVPVKNVTRMIAIVLGPPPGMSNDNLALLMETLKLILFNLSGDRHGNWDDSRFDTIRSLLVRCYLYAHLDANNR